MRLPRFTTLQLLLVTTLVALLAALFTTAWRLRPHWFLIDEIQPDGSFPLFVASGAYLWPAEAGGWLLIPIRARLFPIGTLMMALALWAAVWGVVRKRGRESLAINGSRELQDSPRQRLPTASAPPAMKVCWGVMIVGGLVALGIPIVLMFTIGPLLFPTIYFSLFVGLAAIARGAARDSVNLGRTAGLQLANMIALDPANVVFAAMELALLRSRSVRAYLEAENR